METKRVEKIYSTYAGVYDFVFGGVLEPRISEAVRAMNIKKGDHVLEVGVGTGLSLPYYPYHCTVTGIDLSRKMIEKAKKKAASLNLDHVSLRVMNAEQLEFPDDTFHHVFAAFVITTVPEPRKVLSEMTRVVKRGGQVVLLNHFRSPHPFIGKIEDFLSPFFSRLGWRTDVRFEAISQGTPLEVVSVCKFKKRDPWKIVFMKSKINAHIPPGSNT